ncbi:type I-G CRISPR-associated protein, Cas3-extension family [Candidatus Poriferisodalis sp.]|uniref:type I-G CRISPR-associated protein, Cas3-extension family n=1 Tax=Candidatus Poriferisodalis sp. TaxID=3101277 RepID=UPI003C6FEB31
MTEIELPSLVGSNPLGFLAALGVQVALEQAGESPTLQWSDTAVPHAVVRTRVGAAGIAERAHDLAQEWLDGPALSEDVDPKLKLESDAIARYLGEARAAGTVGVLATCLVAENSLDNGGRAKPSDFYFTAGQMKFVTMAREILSETTQGEVIEDMTSPWRYESKRSSLMWDAVDDRDYALRATNPSSEKKLTNPGAEMLALLGISRYPCFRSSSGTETQGCSGSWKRGTFTWPLWDGCAKPGAVKALLAHASGHQADDGRRRNEAVSYAAWSVLRLMQSQIRRSDQGGYGTFGPAKVIWQRD